MPRILTLVALLAAACLEAGGDAMVRSGLQAPSMSRRLALFVAGGLMLFCYGYVVNRPAWDFGRLLGVYVVFFFLVAQAIGWFGFNQPPSTSTIVGGAFIVTGGVIISSF
jgi:small multidrug resistance family-3 protein